MAAKQSLNLAPLLAVMIVLIVVEVATDILAFPLDEILVPGEIGFDLLVLIVMAAMQFLGGSNVRRLK